MDWSRYDRFCRRQEKGARRGRQTGARVAYCARGSYSRERDVAHRAGESGELLAGADGHALRAALGAIGYAPEDFCALATVAGEGEEASVAPGEPIAPELFREALEALDPEAVLVLDEAAADVLREAYADALVVIEDFDTAMLKPGLVAPVLGRRVLVLDGFERALTDKAAKQRMWAFIKQLPPAGAPY